MITFISRHAQTRLQQRGITYDTLEILRRYGSSQRVKGGKTKVYMDKTAHQRARRSPERDLYLKEVDRLDNIYAIVGDDDLIVTVARSCHRRARRRRH